MRSRPRARDDDGCGVDVSGKVSGSDDVMSCRRSIASRPREKGVAGNQSIVSTECAALSGLCGFQYGPLRQPWVAAQLARCPKKGTGRTRLLRGGRWSVVGCRWSVGTVTVSSWSCHQLCWLAAGQGRAGGAGLRAAAGLDWTGEGNWASQQLLQLASDQRTIQDVGAWVRAGVE